MSRSTLINIILFFVAAFAVYFLLRSGIQPNIPKEKIKTAGDSIIEKNEKGEKCVRDAGGVLIPVKTYRRIVSLSMSADAWLLQCVGAGRISGYSQASEKKPYADDLKGKTAYSFNPDIELLLKSDADIIIMPHSGTDVSKLNRMREAGLNVFNIGSMTGIESFTRYAKQLAYVCDVPVAGDAILSDFLQKMDALSRGTRVSKLKNALYVSVYNDQCYGGVKGSSYHDVLVSAGLLDAADKATWDWASAWPQLSAEQVLHLNPDYIITQSGMKNAIKGVPGFDALDAVKADRVIEVDSQLINDPGLLMYEAAKFIREKVYSGKL